LLGQKKISPNKSKVAKGKVDSKAAKSSSKVERIAPNGFTLYSIEHNDNVDAKASWKKLSREEKQVSIEINKN
jgi:hypothetical protein